LECRKFCPGGHTSLDVSPIEKVCFVVEGELTIETSDGETTLHTFDSCRIAPNEARALKNKTNRPVIVLLSMPLAAVGK
jgi:quercetin dioxygenase-like cupin family protein